MTGAADVKALIAETLACIKANDNARAKGLLESVIALRPADAEAWYYLGVTHLRLGEHSDAERKLRHAIGLNGNLALAHYWLGVTLDYLNRPSEALACYQGAIQANPDHYDAWLHAGRACQTLRRLDDAEQFFHRAAAIKPNEAAARAYLGETLYHLGRYDDAMRSYGEAVARDASNVKAAMGFHLSLPFIYRDANHLLESRQRYSEGLEVLHAGLTRFEQRATVSDLNWSNGFYLAYQGMDDRALQVRYAAFFRQLAKKWYAPFMTPIARRAATGRKIRIGYLSHFFHRHTVSYYFRSWIEQADRARFETIVYHLDPAPDEVTAEIARRCDQYVPITGSLTSVAARVRADTLDILVYPEIGMHPRHYWLAALRLAPVQCVTWGHPVTTGLETIDYAISSAVTEPAGAEAHYSERLVTLPGMGVNVAAPSPPGPATRAEFGLPEGRHVYMCSQSVFKIHPDTDALLARVAARDPKALVLVFQDGRAAVDGAIRNRLEKVFQNHGVNVPERLRIMPRLAHADYLRFHAVADVMLDTLHWSGGRTSLDALACGLPIVTLPGAYSRGRQTHGMLSVLGVNDLIARDEEDFVSIAVRLGTSPAARADAAGAIRERAPQRLFGRSAAQAALEDIFAGAVE
jgi:predicted O-linked N-acetylglucosamine transferase (SPINDLY family)